MPSPYTAAVAKTATTTAGTVDTITLTQSTRFVRVVGRDSTGQLEAWITVDDGAGTPGPQIPTVAGDNVYWLDAKGAVVVETPVSGPTVIHILSTGAFPYHVVVF